MKKIRQIGMMFVGAVTLVVTLAGCAGRWPSSWSSLWPFSRGPAFMMPEVHFQDVKVASAGLTGGMLDVVIAIRNPNIKTDVAVPRLTYRLMVDSTTIGEGIHADSMFIVRTDSAVLAFPVELNYTALTEAGRQLMGRGVVSYTITGDITAYGPDGVVTEPYTETGQFTTFEGVRR